MTSTHKNSIGYRKNVSSDPVEQELRDKWYATTGTEHENVHAELSAYLWNRTLKAVAADRQRHPKAKRNQPVPNDLVIGEGRAIK